LRRWKESLGIGSGKDLSDPDDLRKAIILSLGLEVDGRSDIIIDLTSPGAVESLKKKPFTIKEGATFRMKATFKVQHEVLSGLKYIQVVKHHQMKVRVSKDEEMIVSTRRYLVKGHRNANFI
jgi:Rho GDP-dissociation inhibitor